MNRRFEPKGIIKGLLGGFLRLIGILGKMVGTILLIIIATGLIFACIFAFYVKFNLSSELDLALTDYNLSESSVIYYVDDTTGLSYELQTLYGNENRVVVGYDDIPQSLIDAAVAIEDKRFYSHQGVDWYRTTAAVFNMFLRQDDTFGGSTITQQLIKNLTGQDQVTVKRKLVEIFQALELEKKYTKKQIMEWYLNTIYFGERCYGVETASFEYYGKDVSELSLAECAAIIGITNNPSLYDPYISDSTLENNKERQKDILNEMLDQGKITQEEYEQAISEQLVFQRGSDAENVEGAEASSVYSWFVDEVIRDVTADLMEKFNVNEAAAQLMLYSGGYSIYSTIDVDIQNIVDKVYTNTENLPYADSDLGQSLQSAISIIDPHTGYVVAMAGGVGEKETSLSWNRATQSKRSPGSAIKPITVYGPALEVGAITPYSVLDDAPLYFNYSGGYNGYYPKNEAGYVYSGRVTVMYGLQKSLNTIATKVVDMITPEVSFKFGRENFGLTTLVESRTDSNGNVSSDVDIAPMALGALTDGVSVEELTAAYSAYANDGYYNKPVTYSKVVDGGGNIVLENAVTPTYAVSEVTTYYMNTLLTNAVNVGTGTPARFSNMTIAGKTGTSSSNTDRWFVGYTPYYAAAVWVGFDIPEEIVVSGNNPAAMMWKYIMQEVHENLDYAKFDTPDNIVSVRYCLDCGKLATDACEMDVRGSRVAVGYYYVDDVPTEYCDCHVKVELCDESNLIAGENCPLTHEASLLDFDRSQYPASLVLGDDAYQVTKYGQCELEHLPEVPPDNPHNTDDGTLPDTGGDTTDNSGETGTGSSSNTDNSTNNSLH